MVAGRRLTMNSVHGWFSDNKLWIEVIVAAVVLWLLTMTAISVFDLRSAGWSITRSNQLRFGRGARCARLGGQHHGHQGSTLPRDAGGKTRVWNYTVN